ncbi:MAG: NADH-quinone oxidoreductase subunit J [Flavobacteriales bacterium]|jgi:NADH-quinone oxidoreductase subunit J
MHQLAFNIIFYVTAAVAVTSTLIMITRYNAVHALLYLILSSLSMAIIFFLLGAPFAATLEVIIYAGAIMILFVFVVMMLNLGPKSVDQEKQWLQPKTWIVPGILASILFVVLISSMTSLGGTQEIHLVSAKEVGIVLFGPYLLVVELASFLLLAGLIGAYHIARSPDARAGASAREDGATDTTGEISGVRHD